ncbi:unnamed protein product, partial [Iphiclides podalirius]
MYIRQTTAALLKVGEGSSKRARRAARHHVEAHRGFEARVNSRLECACVTCRLASSRTLPPVLIFCVCPSRTMYML